MADVCEAVSQARTCVGMPEMLQEARLARAERVRGSNERNKD